MDTLIQCLNNKPIINIPPLREFEYILLRLIMDHDQALEVQDRKFDEQEFVYKLRYNLTLETFTHWLESSKRCKVKELNLWSVTSYVPDKYDLALCLNYVRLLEQEVFQLFIGPEYEAPLQLSAMYNQEQFPAYEFPWEYTTGVHNKYKTARAMFKDLHNYQTRGWKLSNFI